MVARFFYRQSYILNDDLLHDLHVDPGRRDACDRMGRTHIEEKIFEMMTPIEQLEAEMRDRLRAMEAELDRCREAFAAISRPYGVLDEHKDEFTLQDLLGEIEHYKSIARAMLHDVARGWRPIETAPRFVKGDNYGPQLLLYIPDYGQIQGCYFSSPKQIDDGWETVVGSIGEPTHWRPLSEEPEW